MIPISGLPAFPRKRCSAITSPSMKGIPFLSFPSTSSSATPFRFAIRGKPSNLSGFGPRKKEILRSPMRTTGRNSVSGREPITGSWKKAGWKSLFRPWRENGEWIHLLTFSEYMDKFPPQGRIYLPPSSYEEMMQWALPPVVGHCLCGSGGGAESSGPFRKISAPFSGGDPGKIFWSNIRKAI